MTKFTSEWLAARDPQAARKVAPAKAPTDQDLEKTLHKEIIQFCARQKWIACHGAMHRPTHRTLGEPDFIILAPRGKVLFIECKGPKGETSDDQWEFHDNAAQLGHKVYHVRSMDEFIAALVESGIYASVIITTADQ